MKEKEMLETTINPYALADLVSDKAINWGTDPNKQQKLLASNLGLSVEDLYSADNPILHPFVAVQSDNTLKTLSFSDAKKRVKNYLDTKLVNVPANLTRSATANKKKGLAEIKRDKIINTLFRDYEKTPDYSKESTPQNTSWKGAGTYFYHAPEGDDPIQGSLGDCYFMAALASVAWATPFYIQNRAAIYYCDSTGDVLENVCHRIDFFKQSSSNNNKYTNKTTVEVTDLIPLLNSTNKEIYARSYDSGETWPAIYEKAFAKFTSGHTKDKPNYQSIDGGTSYVALGQITGGTVTVKYHSSAKAKEVLNFIQTNCDRWTSNDVWGKDGYSHRVKYPMTAAVWDSKEASKYGIYAFHAYSVLGFDYENGQYYVVLRNPHGAGPATKDVKSGSWYMPAFRSGYGSVIPLGVSDPKHKQRWSGIFALKLETFVKIFAYTAVAK